MTLGVAISGVGSDGDVTSVTALGVDVELDDSLRSRMLQAFANPAMGGSAPDFVRWALQVPGITRAWPVAEGMGPGTVVVLVMMDAAEAAFGGFPQGTDGGAAADTRIASTATGDQLTVANAIYPVQPVIARVWVVAPKINTVAFTIAGISGASAAIKSAINAAIDAVFLAQGAPGGVVDLSYINSAIGAISGTAGFVITLMTASHGTITPGVEGNISSSAGYLPQRGAITYSA